MGTKNTRLINGQKAKLLEWVAIGLRSDEINALAEKETPPFHVSRQVVDYYRSTLKVRIAEVQQTSEIEALSRGFAIKSNRVELLNRLAIAMADDLLGEADLIWADDVKVIGRKLIDVERFNQGEVKELREVLRQIAEEVGDLEPGRLKGEITIHFGKPGGEAA